MFKVGKSLVSSSGNISFSSFTSALVILFTVVYLESLSNNVNREVFFCLQGKLLAW